MPEEVEVDRLTKLEHQTIKDKTWGYEVWIANSPLYCGKLLHIEQGCKTSQHFHIRKTETMYVASGVLELKIWEDAEERTMYLEAGDSYLITPGLVHQLIAPHTDVEVYEFSTEHFEDDSFRVRR